MLSQLHWMIPQRDQLVRGGISVTRTSRFELVGSPERPRLRVSVLLAGGPQRAAAIGLGEMFDYDLASWKVEVSGEYAWDGKSLLPERADLVYRLEFVLVDERRAGRREASDLMHNRVEINASLSR